MQSLMLFVMIIAMALLILSVLLALQTLFTDQNETKTALLSLFTAAALIAAVLYVAKTSGMIDAPDDVAPLVGLWSLALVPGGMKLTRDEILNMPAGREMDALIAERVMGHEVNRQAQLFAHGLYYADMSEGIVRLQDYSTNMGAAWDVVEKLENGDEILQIGLRRSRAVNQWNCWLIGKMDQYPCAPASDVYEDTAPLAICRAALLATMQDREKGGE